MCEKKCIQNFRVSVFRADITSARILVWSKIVTQSIIIEVKIRYKSMVDVHGNIVLLLCNCTHVVWLMVDLLTFATRQTALMCGVTVL